jgi:nucleotide-binding universal stress UspA family protein
MEDVMYRSIYIPVDNSDYSNRAEEVGTRMAKTFDSQVVGCHVYAAKMHDYRFKQMEYSLPEEYLEENELERQRKIHDSLITMGLQLISESYLETLRKRCEAEGVDYKPRMMDGKHHVELVNDVREAKYDLTVIGILGLGRVRDSQIGSVCERVVRYCPKDLWVVKHLPEPDEVEGDTILVGIDGSPQSFGALMTGLDLARRFGKKLEAISVYDPYLHYSVFQGLVDKLTEKASKVFRFEEQNQLHEEIIDTGLAQIYQSHLNIAEKMVGEQGMALTKTLLDGKAYQKILDHVRKSRPWVLILGRIGIHSRGEEFGLGSTTENLLRLCPCDILFSTRLQHPELDVKAEESILWSKEAQERMTRVPDMVRGIARTAILRLAVEKGHSVITSSLLDEAMDRFMPKRSAELTGQLAEALVLEQARNRRVAICRRCGVAASEAEPVQCAVCGANDFEVVTREEIERIVRDEGGAAEEKTYDGKSLKWSAEARRVLSALSDNYQRRRAKARIEKSARTRRMDTITAEYAKHFIEEELGEPLPLEATTAATTLMPSAATAEAKSEAGDASATAGAPPAEAGAVVATDKKGVALRSTFAWEEPAIARVLRVPAGFMRDRTQQRIEELAREREVSRIDLELVETGIEFGRQMMTQMVQQYGGSSNAAPEGAKPEAATTAASMTATGAATGASGAASKEQCPARESGHAKGAAAKECPALNEAGPMSALAQRKITPAE